MKALTAGGAMIDTIAIVDDALIESMSMSNAGKTFLLLEQGSKTEASSISTHCGGGGLNAAVSLSRLDFDVGVLAKVGADERARLVRSVLANEGISDRWLAVSKHEPTGASAIISAHERNAAIFTFRGANTDLQAADLNEDAFDADLVYISTLSGNSALLLPDLVGMAARAGAKVLVNPGIRQITMRFESLRKILPQIGILAMNRTEAEAFVRQAIAEISGSENATLRRIAATSLLPATLAEAERTVAARAILSGLLAMGAKCVLLTDGKYGAYVACDGAVHYCPARPAPVVSTAGAGDAFVSTFAALRLQGATVETALRAASVNSASVVQRADTQSGLMRRAPLLELAGQDEMGLTVERWQV